MFYSFLSVLCYPDGGWDWRKEGWGGLFIPPDMSNHYIEQEERRKDYGVYIDGVYVGSSNIAAFQALFSRSDGWGWLQVGDCVDCSDTHLELRRYTTMTLGQINSLVNDNSQLNNPFPSTKLGSSDKIGKGNLLIALGSNGHMMDKDLFEKGNENWDMVHVERLSLKDDAGFPNLKNPSLKEWIENYMKKHNLESLNSVAIFYHGNPENEVMYAGADSRNQWALVPVTKNHLNKYNSGNLDEIPRASKEAIEAIKYLGGKLNSPDNGLCSSLLFLNCGGGALYQGLHDLLFVNNDNVFTIYANEGYTAAHRTGTGKMRANDRTWYLKWNAGLSTPGGYLNNVFPGFLMITPGLLFDFNPYKEDVGIFQTGIPIRTISID